MFLDVSRGAQYNAGPTAAVYVDRKKMNKWFDLLGSYKTKPGRRICPERLSGEGDGDRLV